MKKITMLLTTAMMLAVAGCGEDNYTDTTEPIAIESTQETTQETTSETEEIKVINWMDILPDPEEYFVDKNIAILSTRPDFYHHVEAPDEGEYEAYLEACKDKGFTNITYKAESDTGTMFFAETEDGDYRLEIYFVNASNSIDIIAKGIEKEE